MCRGLVKWVIAAALLTGAFGASANANSILVAFNNPKGTLSSADASQTFEGLLQNGSTSASSVYMWAAGTPGLENSSDAEERAFLAGLLGVDSSLVTSAVINTGVGDGVQFTVSADYFLVKIDGQNAGFAFFQNTDSTLQLTYTPCPGTSGGNNNCGGTTQGNGISHYAAFNVRAVPGPIVGAGIPGLIVVCGALVALARRRRKASQVAA